MGTPPIKIPIQAVDETSVGFNEAQASIERFASETEAQLESVGQNTSRSFGSLSQVIESAFNGNIPSVRSMGGAVSEIAPALQAATAASTDLGIGLTTVFSTVGIVGFGAAIAYVADKYIPQLTDALYGFGDAQKKIFEEAGKDYDKFVQKLIQLRDLQRKVSLDAIQDPVARGSLAKGFAAQDVQDMQHNFDAASKSLQQFNAETDRMKKSGFFGGELFFQQRENQSNVLGMAVADLGIELDKLRLKEQDAGNKLNEALDKQGAEAARKLQQELQKVSNALSSIENQITKALTPKYELIQQEWGKTINELRTLAQSQFPEIAAAAKAAIPQAIRAMNVELEADTKKLLADLDKEFQQFIREHKFSELLGGAPGTQAGAIGDIMSATSKPTWENLPVLNQVKGVTKELFTMNDVIKATGRSFNDMFRGIALGTVEGGNAWENLKRVAVSAIAEIIGKLISLYIMQKLTGMFFAGPGNGTVANLPLNKANPILFPTIPGFAGGGDYAAGMPRIVGENGPELDIPRTAGTIIPNGRFGGDTYNVNVVNPGSVSAAEIKAMVIEGIKISQAKTLNTIRQKAARS